METPDFSKYDETQLRQILTRIDRERFPERVAVIKARLAQLEQGEQFSNEMHGLRECEPKTVDPSKFMVKHFPDALEKVFGPAAPFLVVTAIFLPVGMLLHSAAHPAVAAIALLVGFIAMIVAFVITSSRLDSLTCPECQRMCEKAMLQNGNWRATCNQCHIHWDTGIGSD